MIYTGDELRPEEIPTANYDLAGQRCRVAGGKIFLFGITRPAYQITRVEPDGLGYLITYFNIKSEGGKPAEQRELMEDVKLTLA
jgi:hypothetical protein